MLKINATDSSYNSDSQRRVSNISPTNRNVFQLSTIAQQNTFGKSPNPNISPQNNRTLKNIQLNSRVKCRNSKVLQTSRSPSRLIVNSTFTQPTQIKKHELREQIVYINGKAFISTKKNQPDSLQTQNKKIIQLANRSKSRSLRKSKYLSNHESIVQKVSSPGKIIFQSDGIKENIERQVFDKKIVILEKRIIDLHQEKQNIYIKFCKQNQNLARILVQKQQAFNRLVNDLHIQRQNNKNQRRNLQINIEQLNKQREMLTSLYQKQKYQKQKYKMDLAYHHKGQKSSTTQNFINLSLQQQVQNLKSQNKKLLNQIKQLQEKDSQHLQQGEHVGVEQNHQPQSQCQSLSLYQKSRFTKKHSIFQIYNNQVQILIRPTVNDVSLIPSQKQQQPALSQISKHDKFLKSQQSQNFPKIFQSSHEIDEIDSQQFHIQQIVNKISMITKQNQQLKAELQQNKSQLFARHTVAQETANIIEQIKNLVQFDGIHKQESQQQVNQGIGKNLQKSMKQIKDILSQIY